MREFQTWTARPRTATVRLSRPLAAMIGTASLAIGIVAGPIAAAAETAELQANATAWYYAPTAGTPLPAPGQPPAEAANPTNGLPVGLQNAQHQYRSAVAFQLPALPDGSLVTKFEMQLTEETRGGTVTGVEACAFLAPFAAEPNQTMDAVPEFDCVFSAGGVQAEDDPNTPEVDESKVWTFDLTDTAQAWVDGTVANHGLVLQFTSPENLPVGQPDPSQSNGKVVYAGAESETPPKVTFEYTAAPAGESGGPEIVPPPANADSGSGFTEDSGSSGDFGFSSAPAFESNTAPELEPAPAVAAPESTTAVSEEAPVAAEPAPQAAPVAVAGATAPTTPNYVWLLLPATLGGLAVIARSLVAEPEVAVEREGAITRLMKARRAAEASSPSSNATRNPLLQA